MLISANNFMNILFAINEVSPLYKLGGLGDVGGSLPQALALLGIDIRIIMPYHPDLKLSSEVVLQTTFTLKYGNRDQTISIYLTTVPHTSIPVYLVHEADYIHTYSQTGDNYADKYAVFSLAVSRFIESYSPHWQPQLIHCHDWHTALISVLLKHQDRLKNTRSIITIHNLAYQGSTPIHIMQKLNLKPEDCQILSWDSQDNELNILLEGILHADAITTVSPSYAEEILTSEFGCHLETVLQSKKSRLQGILNGLDIQYFDPQTDKQITHHYHVSNAITQKHTNKIDLYRKMKLSHPDWPLVIYIGRIDPFQKGMDLILNYLYQKNELPNHSFVFLGTGDRDYEKKLHLAGNNSSDISVNTYFDENLAHNLYASADYIVIPSNFEPCGLIQLIAMRYGTIPIANRTGGLKDTIRDNVTGYLYSPNTQGQFLSRITAALTTFEDSVLRRQLIKAAMSQDFSWKKSATAYQQLYSQLI